MYITVETVLDSCGSLEFESSTLIFVVIGLCLGQFQIVQSISRFLICFHVSISAFQLDYWTRDSECAIGPSNRRTHYFWTKGLAWLARRVKLGLGYIFWPCQDCKPVLWHVFFTCSLQRSHYHMSSDQKRWPKKPWRFKSGWLRRVEFIHNWLLCCEPRQGPCDLEIGASFFVASPQSFSYTFGSEQEEVVPYGVACFLP